MPFSPLRTQRLKDRPAWSGTRRRREREHRIEREHPGTVTTVDDGSPYDIDTGKQKT